ncbi:hypothetical protein NUW58_g7615 [Xylaria curta]|uniref:Uncharacterized protein n=1 Tax=Xylaria curta TaxID=42375 RepID=A0ACC1NHQ4_9PEZI|nr:hypothetical protein NUW58_g7615 [Xylaria curta]
MRLLNTQTLDIREFRHDEIPQYAILSHTWDEEEVSLQDMTGTCQVEKRGYQKVKDCCSVAKTHGFEYVWIDTCCIDKTSSAELSEAINSMYRWYEGSEICYAYLADVAPGVTVDDAFRKSRWFTRGWTLQELVAPPIVIFVNNSWEEIGDRSGLQPLISDITGIPGEFLFGEDLALASVAQRMSWAAKRETTRIEDLAYCLMGMFGIYMPMLYGEGQKAFIRLQEEILRVTNDHSLFSWRSLEDHGGILATSPAAFESSGNIISTSSSSMARNPPTVTSRGINLSLRFRGNQQQASGLAILECTEKGKENKRFAIHLRDALLTGQDFTRAKSSTLELLELGSIDGSQYPLSNLYVKQRRPTRNPGRGNLEKCAIKLDGVGVDETRIVFLHPNWDLHDGLIVTTTVLPARGILGRLLVIFSDGNSFQLVLKKRGEDITVDIHDSFETNPKTVQAPGLPGQQQHERDRIISVLGNGRHVHVMIERRILMVRNEKHLMDVVDTSYPSDVQLRHVAVLEGNVKEKTLLSYAACRGYGAIVKILLDTKKLDINSRDQNGLTALSIAASYGRNTIVELLLDTTETDIDSQDENGLTALSFAAMNGHEAVVKLLLKSFANPDSRDKYGRTPLFYAHENKHPAVVKLLAERSAEVGSLFISYHKMTLTQAAIFGDANMVELMLQRGHPLEVTDRDGRTPFSLAAYGGHEAVVKLLLDKGANFEFQDRGGKTPLHLAAHKGHTAVAKLLLDRDVDFELRDHGGRTPLEMAVCHRHKNVIRLLVEKGASVKLGKLVRMILQPGPGPVALVIVSIIFYARQRLRVRN